MSLKEFSNELDSPSISGTSEDLPAYSREPGSYPSTLVKKHEDQQWTSESSAAALRTLHLYAENWRHKHVHILDHDKTTPLYEVESNIMHLSKKIPHLTIRSASTGSVVGTARCHTFKTRIDMTVSDNAFPLTSQGVFKCQYSYNSTALNGLNLTWKSKGLNVNFNCEDENGVLIASLTFPCFAKKKIARLELLDSRVDQEGVLDEIVVTGITVVKMREVYLSYGFAAAAS